MHRKTLEDLAFYRIRDAAAAFCVSQEGVDLFRRREPLTDHAEIERLKSLSREWTAVLHGIKSTPLSSWQPIAPIIKIASANGATLEQEQVYALYQLCQAAVRVHDVAEKAAESIDVPHLAELVATLPMDDIAQADALIEKIIDKNGQLRDLPQLAKIRANIATLHTEINTALRKYTSDSMLASVLESTVPAFRADRQVLAVKAGQRNKINGIVHEVSQSGQTLYIEPEEVVRKNNELVQEEFRLQTEIRKIFTELTAQLQPFVPAYKATRRTLLQCDVTLAAARWGLENHCVYAQTVGNDAPLLLQGRHPLLGASAVPIDIRFLDGKRVLIITGPNTGGKTVTIKTFALLSLLNQAGFPIPAAEGTRLPIFTAIFADIGDEQSIDQSLSTFSAHMKNIAAAAKYADSHSLVLLDELGSGTDPQEGGAIAMAVLDTLIKKQAFVLVTTHHGILKNYGYTNPLCVNASVDFDTHTLAPTYRLLMGVPGESHALDIAKRSGLPSSIVEKATSYLTNEQADVSSLIKGLTQKHAELAELEQAAEQTQMAISKQMLKIDQKELKLRQKENEIKRREQRTESEFLRQTRKRLENLVRELREGEVTREKTLAVKQFIADVTAETDARETALADETRKLKTDSKPRTTAQPVEAAEHFSEGADVIVTATKARGILVRQEKKGVWLVQVGSVRMSFKQADLTVAAPAPFAKPSVSVELSSERDGENAIFLKGGAHAQPVFELRLLGMRTEEALKVLERQLDLCAMQNFRSFSVIHGKGEGILQQAVQDYLSTYPAVREFHFARPEDGGTGKTYVTLEG